MSRPSRASRATYALLALALSVAGLLACGSDLASVRCVSNSECASNRCLGGVCVPNDEDVAQDAGVEDVGEDDVGEDDAGGDTAADVRDDTVADAGEDAATDVPEDTPTDAPTDTPTDAPTDTPTDTATDAPTDTADVPDVDPVLPAPENLVASDGAFDDFVRIAWDSVSGADGYRIYRDDVELAEVATVAFDDGMAALAVPGVPLSVTASSDQPYNVTIRWERPASDEPRMTHVYRVAALLDGDEGALSEPDEGFTAPSPVEQYDVQTDDEIRSTNVEVFAHGGAAAPSLSIERLAAERFGGDVALNVVGLVRGTGTLSNYRVRAISEAGGVGPWSANVSGARRAGLPSYRWERSDGDAASGFATIASGTDPMYTDVDGLAPGDARYYRVVITADGADDLVSEPVRVARAVAPPAAPSNVNATDGTSSAHVDITWNAVSGATSYDVYRDASVIASGLTTTSFRDDGATQGGTLLAPPTITASTDWTDRFRVTWGNAVAGASGTPHAYSVVARNTAGPGERSIADIGYRAGAPVARYEVRIDGGPWTDVGNVVSWNDTDAPPGTIDPGTANASDGTSTILVSLTLTGTETNDGASRSYAVRGVDTDGRPGTQSASASGYRIVSGSPRIVWERSSGDDASGFTDSLLRGASAGDIDAPEDGSGRYYRAVVSATGAADATSNADRGFRAVEIGRLGSTCAGAADCESGVCSNGHCSVAGFSCIPAGTFTMGSPEAELGRTSGEGQHEVTLTHAFVMLQTEVLNSQWTARMGTSPSYGSCGADCPVERINWWDAAAYANALSAFEGLTPCYTLAGCTGIGGGCASGSLFCEASSCTGDTVNAPGGNPYLCEGYRLPTEAEWEYAARAGTETATYAGDLTATDCSDTTLPPIAWFCANATSTRPGGTRLGNDWGLYDMFGNVYEWVWDWYEADLVNATDPLGAATGTLRMLRSASYGRGASYHRAAFRSRSEPRYRYYDTGFRVVRSVP